MIRRPTREDMIQFFNEAKAIGTDVAIVLEMPNQEEPEIIVNYNSSIDVKLNYYINTYDENLIHKNCKDIKIIDMFRIKVDKHFRRREVRK